MLNGGGMSFNASQVTNSLFVSGQFDERAWTELATQGITAVVNMRIEYDDLDMGALPFAYLHLQVVDHDAPKLEQLSAGVAFMREQIEAGGKVLVHCAAGMGRAPSMAAAYLVSEGMTTAEAWATIRRARSFIDPNARQMKRIEEWAKGRPHP
jgi:predicted protein tyrosine phosphatase